MGLLLVIFLVRGASAKKSKEKPADYGTEGMCLGLGIYLGMLVGLAIGSGIRKKSDEEK